LPAADFGLARKFSKPERPMTPRVVTLWYRAPELLFGEETYTTAVDMWSVGCIFGELLQNKPLLPGSREREQVDLICALLGTPTERIWPSFSRLPHAAMYRLPEVRFDDVAARFSTRTEAARKLLKALLTYHPPSRISVRSALRADFFRESPRACAPVLLPTYPEVRN
ncbi:kinase-like domain-containing protein, partial [Blyttiomyces helicus]